MLLHHLAVLHDTQQRLPWRLVAAQLRADLRGAVPLLALGRRAGEPREQATVVPQADPLAEVPLLPVALLTQAREQAQGLPVQGLAGAEDPPGKRRFSGRSGR